MSGDGQQPQEQSNWQFKPDDTDQQSAQPTPVSQVLPPAPVQQVAPAQAFPEVRSEVSWAAAEFIEHEKSLLWYVALIGVTIGLALLVLLLSHDKVSCALIIIIGIIVGIASRRKPRSLQYLLDAKGITINRAFRPYGDFKSFAVVEEGSVNSVIFMPLKRFSLPLSLYVDPEETSEVVAKLSDYLPNDQTHGHDAFDRFAQRIHF